MARLIGCQLLLLHLSLPCPDPTFTGAQKSCDLYYNFVAALRWKDSSLEIAAFQRWLSFSNSKVQNFHMEDTHVLSINYCQLLNSVVSLDSKNSTELFDLGGGQDLSTSLLPQERGQALVGRNDSLVVVPHTSGLAEVTSGGVTRYTGKGSHYHSKVTQEHWAHFSAYCHPFKSLFPSLLLTSLQAQAVHAQEQRAHFYLTDVQPDPTEEALGSNDNS